MESTAALAAAFQQGAGFPAASLNLIARVLLSASLLLWAAWGLVGYLRWWSAGRDRDGGLRLVWRVGAALILLVVVHAVLFAPSV